MSDYGRFCSGDCLASPLREDAGRYVSGKNRSRTLYTPYAKATDSKAVQAPIKVRKSGLNLFHALSPAGIDNIKFYLKDDFNRLSDWGDRIYPFDSIDVNQEVPRLSRQNEWVPISTQFDAVLVQYALYDQKIGVEVNIPNYPQSVLFIPTSKRKLVSSPCLKPGR